MRKRISTYKRNVRYVFIAMPIMMLVTLIRIIYQGGENYLSIGIIAIFIFACIPLYIFFDHAKSFEFDEEHFIIVSKSSEEKIALERILSIKKTLAEVNHRDIWKIKYQDKFNNYRSVRIWPRIGYRYFEEFKKRVILKNPNVEITG